MSGASHHLVHANLALAKERFDHPVMASFFAQVAAINALAQAAPGFVADPTLPDSGTRYREPWLLNVSLWTSPEALQAFVYGGQHAAALRQRRDWFLPIKGPAYVLYWQASHLLPTEEEIAGRFALLEREGATSEAFTFSTLFPSPP